MRPFVDGKNRLMGTSQISAVIKTSLGKKSKVGLRAGDVKCLTEAIDGAGGVEGESSLARRLEAAMRSPAVMAAAGAGVYEAGRAVLI